MKRIFVYIFMIVIASFAEFGKDLSIGARQQGMGGAFSGVANDIQAAFYNPAGLVNISKHEFMFMYMRPLNDLSSAKGDISINTNFLSYGHNFGRKYGSFSLSWYNESYDQEKAGFESSQNIFNLAYGYSIFSLLSDNYPNLEDMDLSIGFSLSWLNWGFYNNDGMQFFYNDKDYKSHHVTGDLGIFFKLNQFLSFGIDLKNLVNFRSKEISSYKEYKDLRVGTAWYYRGEAKSDVIAVDFSKINNNNTIHLGTEKYFNFIYKKNSRDILALRMGLEAGLGQQYFSLNMGGGYRVMNIDELVGLYLSVPIDMVLDYSYKVIVESDIENQGFHNIQLKFIARVEDAFFDIYKNDNEKSAVAEGKDMEEEKNIIFLDNKSE